tara:strand:+ start:208 stop:372 length:165 start_codon:yes stop_codon:yes gene_type:complete
MLSILLSVLFLIGIILSLAGFINSVSDEQTICSLTLMVLFSVGKFSVYLHSEKG